MRYLQPVEPPILKLFNIVYSPGSQLSARDLLTPSILSGALTHRDLLSPTQLVPLYSDLASSLTRPSAFRLLAYLILPAFSDFVVDMFLYSLGYSLKCYTTLARFSIAANN